MTERGIMVRRLRDFASGTFDEVAIDFGLLGNGIAKGHEDERCIAFLIGNDFYEVSASELRELVGRLQ